MEETEEIRSRVFSGSVPVRFDIPDLSFPICANVPRNLSLGHIAAHRLWHFIPDPCASLWFSVGGQPANWKVPSGVLYSGLGLTFPTDVLRVSLRFDDCPTSEVLHWDYVDVISFCFWESVRQAHGIAGVPCRSGTPGAFEAAALSGNFALFAATFDCWFSSKDTWAKWPVRIWERATGRLVGSAVDNRHGVTVRDTVRHTILECPDSVDIQGILISASAPIEEIWPLFTGPDGFLYIVV
jgi:hypothetical protein